MVPVRPRGAVATTMYISMYLYSLPSWVPACQLGSLIASQAQMSDLASQQQVDGGGTRVLGAERDVGMRRKSWPATLEWSLSGQLVPGGHFFDRC